MHYILYQTTNNINGKIYIGCHKTTGLTDHYLGSGIVLKRAIKKYGAENFTRIILADCDSVGEMYDMEAIVVNEDFIAEDTNYNIKVGGKGGFTVEAIKNSHAVQMEKNGRLGGVGFLGKVHSEETKRRIGETNSKKQKGSKNSQFGTCWVYSETAQKSIKIMKTELNSYLKKGWVKGRKIKF